MGEIKVSDELTKNYQECYDIEGSEWRRRCSIGKAENILSLCIELPRNSVLEIGAGDGSILSKLTELNFCNELFAIEISQSGVDAILNKNIPGLAECKIFDGYHIPYDDNKFDIAILSHVVEHVEHPRKLIYEASRVARYVFVEVPLEDTSRLPENYVFDEVGHINFYSMKTIRRLLQSSDLEVMNEIITNSPKNTYTYERGLRGVVHYYVKQISLAIFPALATRLFCYHGSLVCKKMHDGK